MTIVPRTGPFSASSALATTSWYQRGKSVFGSVTNRVGTTRIVGTAGRSRSRASATASRGSNLRGDRADARDELGDVLDDRGLVRLQLLLAQGRGEQLQDRCRHRRVDRRTASP